MRARSAGGLTQLQATAHSRTVIKQVCVEPRSSALNMTLPAFAAECGRCSRCRPTAAGTRRSQLSTDICCPRPCSAANQPHAAAAVDRRDRRTDGQTDTRPLHRPCSTYYVQGSVQVKVMYTSFLKLETVKTYVPEV